MRNNVPEPDEHGYWTRRPDGGLHYHAYEPATEDDEDEAPAGPANHWLTPGERRQARERKAAEERDTAARLNAFLDRD